MSAIASDTVVVDRGRIFTRRIGVFGLGGGGGTFRIAVPAFSG
jgi:hypothetical protein